jgi:DNA-binding winged helix-turn-helix (wHTH) protein
MSEEAGDNQLNPIALRVDLVHKCLIYEGQNIFLTQRLLKVIKCIHQASPFCAERGTILAAVWGDRSTSADDSNVDKAIDEINKKLLPYRLEIRNESRLGYRINRIQNLDVEQKVERSSRTIPGNISESGHRFVLAAPQALDGKSQSSAEYLVSPRFSKEKFSLLIDGMGIDAVSDEPKIMVGNLPEVNPVVFGRLKEFEILDRAWANPATNFVQIFAAGGTGKTALLDKWFRRHLNEAPVFGWSFYRQGSSLQGHTSSEEFFAEIMCLLEISIPRSSSIYTQAEIVASHLRRKRMLLLLDGIEALQNDDGSLHDSALKALFAELRTANNGLVVCTTRFPLDIHDDPPRVLSIDLDNLTPTEGMEYLRSLHVDGTDEELLLASQEYENHALALTLLGTYLVNFCDGNILRRFEIHGLHLEAEEGKERIHARRIIEAYDRVFAGKPENDLLHALGYFDRPAERPALKLLLPELDERKYRIAATHLYNARLILSKPQAQQIDCHPLIREHFALKATKEGHDLLFKYYKEQAPYRPNTLHEMTPLFHAVYHGCRAGHHEEVLRDVYRDRIMRDREYYLTNNLGALGTDLSLLSNFFQCLWTVPLPTLAPDDQAWITLSTAFSLRAHARLIDAAASLRTSAVTSEKQERWLDASLAYRTLSEVQIELGELSEAVTLAREKAVIFADRSGDTFNRMAARSTLAYALHLSGKKIEAEQMFEETENIQAKWPSRESDALYSLRGYRYCELLLSQGKVNEVRSRATASLAIAERKGWLLDIGLDHVSLGGASTVGSAEAADHFDRAVKSLKDAGQMNFLPLALLARGTPQDMDEVFRIAKRFGLRLHLADFHLLSARRALAQADQCQARLHFDEARSLILDCGYHRRDADLESVGAQLREIPG